jgi:hypothetical protein
MASRATMKLLSRVSSRTNENIPSNMSTKFSPYSSYYKQTCTKTWLLVRTKNYNYFHSTYQYQSFGFSFTGNACNLIIKFVNTTNQMGDNITVTACSKLVIWQALPQFFMIVNFSIHLFSTPVMIHQNLQKSQNNFNWNFQPN